MWTSIYIVTTLLCASAAVEESVAVSERIPHVWPLVSVSQCLHNIVIRKCFCCREILPDADPRHLLVASVPFSDLVGHPVMLVYDASSEQDYNPCAARMTTSVSNGLAVQVRYSRSH